MIRKGYNMVTSVVDAALTGVRKLLMLVVLVAVIVSVITASLITLGATVFGR